MADLHLDWETRSAVSLKTSGLDRYSKHPSTDIWVAAYAFGDKEIQTWFPGDPVPIRIKEHISGGHKVTAHNAGFEFEICNSIAAPRYGWPTMKFDQLECTMVLGYARALPGSLDDVAKALSLTEEKDAEGRKLMMKMAKPRVTQAPCPFCEHGCDTCFNSCKVIRWHDEIDNVLRLAEYCKQDVATERALRKKLFALTESEYRLWQLDHKINASGVRVDLDAVAKATEILEFEKDIVSTKLQDVSGGAIKKASDSSGLKRFLATHGYVTESVDKEAVHDLLQDTTLPAKCRRALELRQEGNKTSTAKLSAYAKFTSTDGYLRNALQFNGAAATRRWAGRGVQIHNLPRTVFSVELTDYFFSIVKSDRTVEEKAEILGAIFPSITDVVSTSLRGFLVPPPNKLFYVADFSSIEAKVLAWLAGEEQLLKVFRAGKDVYVTQAAVIYNVREEDVTDFQRLIGKIAILALGYQGGWRAFQSMAANFQLEIPKEQAETIKKEWRAAHPRIVEYWKKLETAFMNAYQNPTQTYSVKSAYATVKYKRGPDSILCLLPSGGVIEYPQPQLKVKKMDWGPMKTVVTYGKQDSKTKKWGRAAAYGGLLAENVTQATARDNLKDGLLRLGDNRFSIDFHVHDEIIGHGDGDPAEFETFQRLMGEVSPWAKGLPLGTSGFTARRYRK